MILHVILTDLYGGFHPLHIYAPSYIQNSSVQLHQSVTWQDIQEFSQKEVARGHESLGTVVFWDCIPIHEEGPSIVRRSWKLIHLEGEGRCDLSELEEEVGKPFSSC